LSQTSFALIADIKDPAVICPIVAGIQTLLTSVDARVLAKIFHSPYLDVISNTSRMPLLSFSELTGCLQVA
jgi:hypothetical protein